MSIIRPVIWVLLVALQLTADDKPPATVPLELANLHPVNSIAEIVTYRGRRAVHLFSKSKTPEPERMFAIVVGTDFHNGTIEADVIGLPRPDAPPDSRGFVGLAFHVQRDGAQFEDIFIRPLNARADDQLRRNHTMQYQSVPQYPWNRFRDEAPGVYESYCDIEPGEWTRLKIEVEGTKARAYVNDAVQPCLIVNDLKLGDVGGAIALWANWTSDAYFSGLRIERK